VERYRGKGIGFFWTHSSRLRFMESDRSVPHFYGPALHLDFCS
jgi:hypothetical protein